MPAGGKRERAGRPKGSVAVRHAPVIAEPDGLMPVDWLLAVLRDPLSEPARRDAVAIACMPYLHPRLSTVVANVTGQGGGDTTINNNTLNIFAVPRGAVLDLKDGKVSIEGAPATTLDPVEPFTGTPALTDQRDTNQQTNKAEPLPVQEVDTSNVTRLDRAFDAALRSVGTRRPPPDSDDRP